MGKGVAVGSAGREVGVGTNVGAGLTVGVDEGACVTPLAPFPPVVDIRLATRMTLSRIAKMMAGIQSFLRTTSSFCGETHYSRFVKPEFEH